MHYYYISNLPTSENPHIYFANNKNEKCYSIDCLNVYKDYRGPKNEHYYNKELNEVIVYDTTKNIRVANFHPFIVLPSKIELNNKIYYPCNQFQFDKWHYKEFPHTDNAKIYALLKDKFEL